MRLRRSHLIGAFILTAVTVLYVYRRRGVGKVPIDILQKQPLDKPVLNSHTEANIERAAAVKEAFLHAWAGYNDFAFGHNELLPLSRSWADTRSAWGATAVDSLSTAILMDLPEVVTRILQYVETVDFSTTPLKVSVFQATKTFVGGLLSAHDLLSGPKSSLISAPPLDVLVTKAQVLADALQFAFKTPSKLAQNNVVLQPVPKHRKFTTTDLTASGTLMLEWTHLSDLTGQYVYSDLVEEAEQAIFSAPQEKCDEPFPGLLSKTVRLKTGRFESSEGGYGSGCGSYYEYLLKMYIYSPGHYPSFRDRWTKATDSAMRYLASNPSTRPEHMFLAGFNCGDLMYTTDHSAFFAPGNFILGGSVLGQKKYVDFGLSLLESQVERCLSTITRLCPERYAWLPAKCSSPGGDTSSVGVYDAAKEGKENQECLLPPECSNQGEFYARNGFCILDPVSKLRPEVLESLYYAYRLTGQRKYQDMSWELFKAINQTARVRSGGFSEVQDVNISPDEDGSDGRVDRMYGYFMAETLKYAYLIHMDDAEWQTSADGKNEWVFSTQAHPLKVRKLF